MYAIRSYYVRPAARGHEDVGPHLVVQGVSHARPLRGVGPRHEGPLAGEARGVESRDALLGIGQAQEFGHGEAVGSYNFV